MFDNAVLTRIASAQPNLLRDLQALSWSHGFHARSVASLTRHPHPGSPPTANPGATRRPPERRSHDPVRHGLTHRHRTKDARRHPRRDPRPRDRRACVEARRGPSPRNRRAHTGNPGGPRPGNHLRPLRALHGRTFKRLREHGALWNRSGRRARRRYPRTRTGAGMHHPQRLRDCATTPGPGRTPLMLSACPHSSPHHLNLACPHPGHRPRRPHPLRARCRCGRVRHGVRATRAFGSRARPRCEHCDRLTGR